MIYIWTDKDPTKKKLPIPCKFDWQFSDLDKNSGRNDFGLMMRERIGSKVKITISWNPTVNKRAGQDMIRFLKGLPPYCYMMYPDPDGSIQTIECYRGDIKSSMYHYDLDSGSIWKETSTSFTER
jgi:hypothetical protein